MNKNKLLSICIPTFNRANLLNNLLNSIDIANIDASIVEVCISDNNSTDNTKEKVITKTKPVSDDLEPSEIVPASIGEQSIGK